MKSRRFKFQQLLGHPLLPGGEFDVLAINDLGSPAYATPAIADGRIYIRTDEALWAFGEE